MIKSKGEKVRLYKEDYYDPGYGRAFSDVEGLGNYAEIIDERPHFKRFGDCIHRRTRVKETGAYSYGSNGDFSTNPYCFSFYEGLAATEDSGFNSRAFTAMKPRIATAVQAPLEIKEFLFGWRELLKPFSLGKSTLSKAGSTNLWWQFGVAPTLGTIKDVKEALNQFEQRLNTFLKLQGEVLTTHYTEIQEISATDRVLAGNLASTYPWQVKQTTAPYKLRRTATMSYKYVIPKAQTLRRETIELLAMADTFGISAGVSMLWEAFPWSFVWDWFFSVGEFLEQFDKPFLDTDVEVIDYCISEKATRTAELLHYRSATGFVLAYEISQDFYQRVRCLPDYSYFGIRMSGNFGIRQFFLGLSLLVS